MPPVHSEPPVAAVLLSRAGEIAEAVTARCVEEIPAYRVLPESVREGDLVANVRAVIELFLTSIAAGRAPTDEELSLPIVRGGERTRDGLPLEAVLRIYPLGAQQVWAIATEVLPDRPGELTAMVEPILDFLAVLMPRVAESYLREQRDLDWEHRESRQHLAASLLAGRPARRAAERGGRTLAERYTVVAFHLAVPEASPRTGAQTTTAVFRRMQTELDTQPDVLAGFERDGGVLLVPCDPREATPERTRVARLLARIGTAAGTPCTAGAVTAPDHPGIPDAHRQAAEILTLARRLAREPGIYWLDDLAVEYQLAQPGPARDRLAAVLVPLDGHPHLFEALRAFLASGHSRDEAAAALTIHRNTLTYRLNRIRTITGYDPTRPEHARHLAAALTARDVAAHDA
ncbi:PucR family transcriptional regulator [Amycolatopsis sp. NPDC059027]|uniref:PucR family transcriptional regulator n=1 Tax=Amycolatopsis sp. NPDC059027 TaxID=3346709 RepID=UPI0036701ACB